MMGFWKLPLRSEKNTCPKRLKWRFIRANLRKEEEWGGERRSLLRRVPRFFGFQEGGLKMFVQGPKTGGHFFQHLEGDFDVAF